MAPMTQMRDGMEYIRRSRGSRRSGWGCWVGCDPSADFGGWRRCRLGWNASADHADLADAGWDGVHPPMAQMWVERPGRKVADATRRGA